MPEEGFTTTKTLFRQGEHSVERTYEENSNVITEESSYSKTSDQLSSGLLGWYSVCSSSLLKDGELNFFSMFNEPLVLYRDKEGRVRCVKDLCPHRGASFQGGALKEGDIICPYHGGRFSSDGNCTNLERLTCSHIIDSNYNNYAKRIHLYQYPCVEKQGYIYIYYTGKAKTDIKDFEIKSSLENLVPETFGFDTSEYSYEEVCVDFKCDWSRIIENHLDILHIFWIHGNTIPDKDVNREAITSFNQKIKRDEKHIESKYNHKDKEKGEFITVKFIPPGRICIYKGTPETARYIQILDHIPLAQNRARVIVRHYRKFLRNKVLTSLFLFKQLQHRIFYRIFSEDYLVLKTQTYNEQMGFIKKDKIKLLGEDKAIQYYWDWYKASDLKDTPWQLNPTSSNTNSVYKDMPMIYPPENMSLMEQNNRSILINLVIRALVPIGFIILLI